MVASNRKCTNKRGMISKPARPIKRSSSFSSVSSALSVTSIRSSVSTSTAAFLQAMVGSDDLWECPHCPCAQHTKRLPEFLCHQRSHFVSQFHWPCPNPKCGKGFACKDSLKRITRTLDASARQDTWSCCTGISVLRSRHTQLHLLLVSQPRFSSLLKSTMDGIVQFQNLFKQVKVSKPTSQSRRSDRKNVPIVLISFISPAPSIMYSLLSTSLLLLPSPPALRRL